MPNTPFRPLLRNALRFWEPRRILYNLILLAVCAAWVALTWPHFRTALTLHTLLPMSVLALLANLCYSAAYLVDLPLQYFFARPTWLRRRWLLFLAGTIFAALLASYWISDEIAPDFHSSSPAHSLRSPS